MGLPLILVDANLLIYARVSAFSEHERAKEWLDGELTRQTGVGLPELVPDAHRAA